MVSKSSEREGDKGSKFGLMDYTKQTRQQITYNNLETGVCGQVFVRTSKVAVGFQCSALVCGKADFKDNVL